MNKIKREEMRLVRLWVRPGVLSVRYWPLLALVAFLISDLITGNTSMGVPIKMLNNVGMFLLSAFLEEFLIQWTEGR